MLIRRVEPADVAVLAALGKQTFIESHGHSADQSDIDLYVGEKYSVDIVQKEIVNPEYIQFLLEEDGTAAGYSRIILDAGHPEITYPKVTKLERLYVLRAFHDRQFGMALFQHNVALSKAHDQEGMWLYVWKENERAIRFYRKAGFECIGSYDFRISPRHTNPNHLMWLKY